ncbi:ubiquinone biosynthesis protein COQ9, mitochondrial-like isoform X2 [Planococcus citri]|uniref:ubiquinone biosynthesis protein COQ9, mitochondrial-like isoform X2 n=1 Tax=Planococcus citri TaxID=170843 RepID=UPI0031F9F417
MFRVLKRASKSLLNEGLLSVGLIESPIKFAPACGIQMYQCVFQEKSSKNEVIDRFISEDQINSAIQNDVENENKNDNEYEKNIRNKILAASLNHVSVHGWTKAAIVAGAQSIGYPGVIGEMFPLGGCDLVLYFYSVCNEQLCEYLKNKPEVVETSPTDKQKLLKIFVSDAIETRLRMIIPYIDKWPQALATLTLSRAVPTALSNLLTLVDDICYYAGDRSVDFDWYVRRIALAGIYKVTELYMLQDKSPDYENTWKFLKTQLDDATALYSCIQQSEQASQLTKEISQATFTTARNILGLNWKR